MATAPKKDTPAKAGSLEELLKNKNTDTTDNKPENDSKNDDADVKEDETPETSENSDTDSVEKPESVVFPTNKEHVDQTVNDDNSDPDKVKFGNPNGVSFGNTPYGVIDKTPADLAAETPEQTKARYNLNDQIPDEVHENPNVTISRDNRIPQIASGTHLHPDVAKDTYNSSLGIPSESAVVSVPGTQRVFATEAELDDKGFKNDPVDGLA